jgi:hypothetical protein
MDPFLEHPAYWSDFHPRFIYNWADAIADVLPDQYDASIGEHVWLVDHDPEVRKLINPDVAVVASTRKSKAKSTSAGAVTLSSVTVPLKILILDRPRQGFIKIVHKPDNKLVTVLELLSPANKEKSGRTEYLAKRRAILHQKVHLVELDLLRTGRRMPTSKPLPFGDCFYLVARAEKRPDVQAFAWTVRDKLPCLPVPLRTPDPDITFDLGAVFTTTYDHGRFGRKINYSARLAGLGSEDQKWAAEIVRSAAATAPG